MIGQFKLYASQRFRTLVCRTLILKAKVEVVQFEQLDSRPQVLVRRVGQKFGEKIFAVFVLFFKVDFVVEIGAVKRLLQFKRVALILILNIN